MRSILIQAVKFIGFSGIGWLLDFSTYIVLGLVSSNLLFNNVISSWVGVTFVFIFATRKVFQSNSIIPLKTKYFIYVLYQIILIFLISKLLNVVNDAIISNIQINLIIKYSSVLSKIIVTPVTMILNFFVMKGVIEKL